MDPENIMKHNLNALGEVLRETIGENEYAKFRLQMQNNWDVWWEVLKKGLIQLPLTDRNSTLLYVAENYLPDYRKDRVELSLSLHDSFWNEFYINMLKAKALLLAP